MASPNTPALPTISALRHLEPRPGGQWAVTGQSANSYSLAYIMDGGADAICYTMQPCATEEDVRAHCGAMIYGYSEGVFYLDLQKGLCSLIIGNFSNGGGNSTPQNAGSEAMHLVIRPKQDDGSNGTGLAGLALDPLMINPIPEHQPLSSGGEQQSHFGVSQVENQNSMYDLGNGSANSQNQQQIMGDMNGDMAWSVSGNMLPVITTMAQLPDIQATAMPNNGNNVLLSELWDENFGRVEPVADGTGSQPAWQFASS